MAQVDVVMSAYNTSGYIAHALAGIQNQTLRDIKIIVVDDGSTDNTKAIVLAAQEVDERIVYVYQDNSGIVSAVNAGIALCTAPFVARHDSDDFSYPERFEKEVAFLEGNNDCVAVSGLSRHIDERGLPLGTTSKAKDMALVDDTSLPANEPYISQPFLMMRSEAFRAAGGYRSFSVAEDTDLYWRLASIGRLHVVPEILGDYRIHADSISSKSIVSGRRMAAWSQLAALSAQRRRKGIDDFCFTPELQSLIDTKYQLFEMFETIRPLMSADEALWLYSAMAAKIVELCYYRPFELERSDIEYIRAVPAIDIGYRERPGYLTFKEGVVSAGIRLGIRGDWRSSLYLVPLRDWPLLIVRVAFRSLIPNSIRARIKTISR